MEDNVLVSISMLVTQRLAKGNVHANKFKSRNSTKNFTMSNVLYKGSRKKHLGIKRMHTHMICLKVSLLTLSKQFIITVMLVHFYILDIPKSKFFFLRLL